MNKKQLSSTITRVDFDKLIKLQHIIEKTMLDLQGVYEQDKVFQIIIKNLSSITDKRETICLMDKENKHLRMAASAFSSKILKGITKLIGLSPEDLDFMDSASYREVIYTGKTVIGSGQEITQELFQDKPILPILLKLGIKTTDNSIIIPVKKYGKTIGTLGVTAPEYSEQYIPSLEMLAALITNNLERGDELNKLTKIQANMALAQKTAHVGSWDWDIATGKLTWSDEMFNIFGIEKEGFNGNLADVIDKAIHPEDRAKVDASNRSVLEKNQPIPVEYRIILPNGTERILWAEAGKIILGNDRTPVSLSGYVQDITERKLAEKKLRDSEILLNETGAMAKVGGWMINLQTQKLIWTKAVYDIHEVSDGFQPSVADAINFYDNDSKLIIQKAVDEAIQLGKPFNVDLGINTAKGNHVYVRAFGHVQKDVNGQTIAVLGAFQDITESKNAEQKIQGLLTEKEALLKEVHHRIKNNMNTLVAMLGMQIKTVSEPAAIKALEDSQNRLRSMMILYDKLYRSQKFKEMSTKIFFPTLIDQIAVIFSGDKSIQINKQIDDINLEAKTLSSLGIIINELITNSIKYASLEKGTSPEFEISFQKQTDGSLLLRVRDNGVGLPEGFRPETSLGFGLNLVRILTEQLNGEIKFESSPDKGTEISISFKDLQ